MPQDDIHSYAQYLCLFYSVVYKINLSGSALNVSVVGGGLGSKFIDCYAKA